MEEAPPNNYFSKREKRQAKREEERRQTNLQQKKRVVRQYGVWVVVLAVIGYGIFFLVQRAGPEGEDFSRGYADQGRDHIAPGTEHPAYNSNPPSSGWHTATAVRGGFYETPLPDEQVIHNLEHGDIWIAYHPRISDAAKEALESFAGQYVVVSPREDNEDDISLVAWGRVDTFAVQNGVVDAGRIRDFITRYDNRGPENVRGGRPGL